MDEIRYALSGETHIAYRVLGDGPWDLVLASNWLTDIETLTDLPSMAQFIANSRDWARLLIFDQPGTGHSDPLFGDMPSVETYAGFVGDVMDAAEVERAVVLSWDIGSAPAIMFAASHPERVTHLVLTGGTARWIADESYEGIPADAVDATVDTIVGLWGTTDYARWIVPTSLDDHEFAETVARWLRTALSPGMARRVFDMALRVDVRDLLPLVACPTLIVSSRRSPAAWLSQARYLAEHIPNARHAIFDSPDHIPYSAEHKQWSDDVFQEFVTGERPAVPVDNRVLATVAFTDIVESTSRAAELGDQNWHALLARHNEITARTVARYNGRVVKSTGDGTLQTFDGPARAIRCLSELHDEIRRIGLDVRAGLHTGEVESSGSDVQGIAVHIAARIAAMATGGETLVSSTVKDLVAGSGIRFADRGTRAFKGVPDKWRIFAVKD